LAVLDKHGTVLGNKKPAMRIHAGFLDLLGLRWIGIWW